jgi:hypothetical protein
MGELAIDFDDDDVRGYRTIHVDGIGEEDGGDQPVLRSDPNEEESLRQWIDELVTSMLERQRTGFLSLRKLDLDGQPEDVAPGERRAAADSEGEIGDRWS